MKLVRIQLSLLLIIIFSLQACQHLAKESVLMKPLSEEYHHDLPAPSGCTVFTISKGENVFFGCNDDYINPDSYYWVDPGDSVNYGVIWIGEPDNVQQGVNEKGLAYDPNGLPRFDVNPHSERIPVSGDYSGYPIRIMHECSIVKEVIDWINAHQWHSYMHDQMQFADVTGDAVIISAGKDGEIVFTRKSSGDGFLVSTNFNVANTANSYGYPCRRYEKVQELLGQLLNKAEPLSAKDATSVLEAVHAERGASWTIESLVADLVKGMVYLYYYHQYERPVMLNVREELSGLAGIFLVAMPLVNRYLSMSQLIPLSPWVVIIWWAIVVLGALAGGFLIFLYERWAVKQGFQAGIMLAGNEGEVITPSWRRLCWWILISIVILFAGLIAGVMLLNILK